MKPSDFRQGQKDPVLCAGKNNSGGSTLFTVAHMQLSLFLSPEPAQACAAQISGLAAGLKFRHDKCRPATLKPVCWISASMACKVRQG